MMVAWRSIKQKGLAAGTIGLLGVAGVVLMLVTHAATPALSLEPETGALTAPAVVVTDGSASGGRAVQFGSGKKVYGCTTGQATGASATNAVAVSGAIPNDAGDDTAAIQNAINTAGNQGGGVVTLPAGTFVIDGHLVLKDNVKLQGSGPATILKAGPHFMDQTGSNGGYSVVSSDGASNVTIANLTADQSGDTLNGNVSERLTGYLVDVRSSTNAVVDNVHTINPFTYSIAIVESSKFCVENSSTRVATSGKYDQLDGIHILNSSNGDVVNNDVDQRIGSDGDDGLVAHTIGGTVSNVTYAGNTVRGGSNGSGMQLAYSSSGDRISNLRILDNYFHGGPDGIQTGAYGGSGSVDHITISGNTFMDNGTFAVNFSGSLSNITVTNNNACRSGGFTIGSGSGNVVSNNQTNAC